jgi:hypothetical protein
MDEITKQKINKIKAIGKDQHWYAFASLKNRLEDKQYPLKGYSIKRLSTKEEKELDKIILDFEEHIKNIEQQMPKDTHFYNKPEYDADFEYWSKQAYWTIEEGLILLAGKDPLKLTWDDLNKYPYSPLCIELKKRRALAYRYVTLNELLHQNLPSFFLAWVQKMKYSIPIQLLDKVEQFDIKMADWQSLYQQQKPLYEDAVNLLESQAQVIQQLTDENKQLKEHGGCNVTEDSEYYSLELDIANIIQRKIISSAIPIGEVRSTVKNYVLEMYPVEKYPHLSGSKEALERLAIIINPRKAKLGGCKKTVDID